MVCLQGTQGANQAFGAAHGSPRPRPSPCTFHSTSTHVPVVPRCHVYASSLNCTLCLQMHTRCIASHLLLQLVSGLRVTLTSSPLFNIPEPLTASWSSI